MEMASFDLMREKVLYKNKKNFVPTDKSSL